MRPLLFALLSLLLAPWVQAASPFVTPGELQHLQQMASRKGAGQVLRIIDIRDAYSFDQQHIPGSLNLPYNQWRGPASNPGQLPALQPLTRMLGDAGVGREHTVVVVSNGGDALDFGAAARVYWTLKYLGVSHLALLQGGLNGWDEALLPLDSGPATPHPAVEFTPRLQPQLLAITEEVKQQVQTGQARLVDARPRAFFLGQSRVPQAKAAGTLPGAVHLDNERWFENDGATLISRSQAQQLADDLRIAPRQATVLFCNTGHLAATNWFVLSEVLGLPDVKLYTGSMVEWTQQAQALPMANEPRRLQQLWMDAQLWMQQRRP